ncbi:19578_t:CDS:2, partial [Gigaspora rosea]
MSLLLVVITEAVFSFHHFLLLEVGIDGLRSRKHSMSNQQVDEFVDKGVSDSHDLVSRMYLNE